MTRDMSALWELGRDVPVDHDENDVLVLDGDWPDADGSVLFPKGADLVHDVWTWFDEHHIGGVVDLMRLEPQV